MTHLALRHCLYIFLRNILLALLALDSAAKAEPGNTQEEEALHWLSEMQHSVATLNYKGVIAYLKKEQQVESFQLFHASVAGSEQERLVSMNSPLREVVRTSQQSTCFFPDQKKVFVENNPTTHTMLVDLPTDLKQLTHTYRVALQGQEHVVQRLSQVIGIEPKDDYRYARLIWIDTDSKLPLKFEMLNEEGETVEQMVFTSISTEKTLPKDMLMSSVQTDGFTWETHQRDTLPLASLQWKLQSVPEGFQMIAYHRLKPPSDEHVIEHILLSDGFSSVSVYIGTHKDAVEKEPPQHIGPVHVYTVQQGKYSITVMGEVPLKTVRTIANGLRYHQNGNK